MHNAKREDLRIVRAVAERGFFSAAKRVLGTNHAAVLRQIAACQGDHNAVIVGWTRQPGRMTSGFVHSPEMGPDPRLPSSLVNSISQVYPAFIALPELTVMAKG